MVINQKKAAVEVDKNTLSVEPKSKSIPTLSIIIPTYNSAAFLPAALDSVFSQAFPSLEIIVVDDGSTDETQTVLAAYAGSIRYLYQPNAGSAAARNTGLGIARGAYIVFLDADDVLLPGKFAAQAAILDERPSIDMVHSGWQVIDAEGKLLHTIEPWHQAPELDVIAWFKTKPIRLGAMMFRRRCLETVGGLDPGIRQSHDVDLLLRLALDGYATAWLKQPTMAYRSYATSTIRRGARKQHGYVVRVMNKFFDHPRVPAKLREQEHHHRYYNLRWLAWHLVQSGFPDAILSPLRQGIVHSPLDAASTLFDVWHRFGRFCDEDDLDVNSLRPLLPTLRRAFQYNEADWMPLARLLGCWLDNWPLVRDWPFRDLNRALDRMRHAVAVEDELGLSAETILSWWIRVWWPLLAERAQIDGEALRPFTTLTAPQLLELIKYCIVQQPDQVTLAIIETCWQNLLQHRLIPETQQGQVVGLYLTYFGQQLLRRNRAEAVRALRQAIRSGMGRDFWQAWGSFIRKAAAYGGMGQTAAGRWLVVDKKLRDRTAVMPMWQELAAAGENLWLASNGALDAGALGLPRGSWLPLKVLSALAQAGHLGARAEARLLRSRLKEQYQFDAARRLPRWKRPFSTIYVASLFHLSERPELLQLNYPLVCGCAPLDCAVLDVQRQDPDFARRLDAVLEQVTAVHCYTPATQKIVMSWGVPATKVAVVSPGVDTTFYTPAEIAPAPTPLRLVMIAPFTWANGFAYALPAVQMAVAQGVALQVDVVGAGIERERLLFTRHDLDLETVVHLHEPLDAAQRRALLQQAHLFLAAPVADVWSQPLLEAMACGLPVVGTAVPSLSGLVRDGKEGSLVPPRQPDRMAAAIVKLAADEQMRTNLGQAARQRAQAFALSRQAVAFQAMLGGHRDIVQD